MRKPLATVAFVAAGLSGQALAQGFPHAGMQPEAPPLLQDYPTSAEQVRGYRIALTSLQQEVIARKRTQGALSTADLSSFQRKLDRINQHYGYPTR